MIVLQLGDGELLADLVEGGDVRGDAAPPALSVTLGARELREVVGAGGDALADVGRSAVRDGADDGHGLRDRLRAPAADEAAGNQSEREADAESRRDSGTRHDPRIRRSTRSG